MQFIGVAFIFSLINAQCRSDVFQDTKTPSVLIEILVKNNIHVLPYFLTLLSRLNYPKEHVSLWIRGELNGGSSSEIIERWLKHNGELYQNIDLKLVQNMTVGNQDIQYYQSHFCAIHALSLRQEAINEARKRQVNYIWILDSDMLITDGDTLIDLIRMNRTVVAPVLVSEVTHHSNIQLSYTRCSQEENKEQLMEILERKQVGCFEVSVLNGAILVHLANPVANALTYISNSIYPQSYRFYDSNFKFAVSANASGIRLYACNEKRYGYIMQTSNKCLHKEDASLHLVNLKLSIATDSSPLPLDESVSMYVKTPKPSTFGFDRIFIINLAKRPNRRNRMFYSTKELGMSAVMVEAVDGSMLSDEDLRKLNIQFLDEYEDPFYKRPMKKGEIGCFLSHYNLWKLVVEKQYKKVMILEDDVRFVNNFINRLKDLTDVELEGVDWDLLYLGRKSMNSKDETFYKGSRKLVHPEYSYWTLGYLITLEGAQKLIQANPLQKLLPVDEFLPIMYDKHPRYDWKNKFVERTLNTLSVYPLMVYPMKYINEPGYVSDTEDSMIISKKDEL